MSTELKHLAHIIEQNPDAMELFSESEQVKVSILLVADAIDDLDSDDYVEGK